MFYFEDTTGRGKLDDDDSLVFLNPDTGQQEQDDAQATDNDKMDESVFERVRQLV